MGTSLLWIAGIALESVILFRFLKHRLYAHYPLLFRLPGGGVVIGDNALARLSISFCFLFAVILG